MGSSFDTWLYEFRCKARHQQINWMKSYVVKHRKTNMHMTEEQFVSVFGSRMASFLSEDYRTEDVALAAHIAKEGFEGKYEPSSEYKKPGALAKLKFKTAQPREPYVVPTQAKNDGEVHEIELVAE